MVLYMVGILLIILSRFPTSAVGTNWPFCVETPSLSINQSINPSFMFFTCVVMMHIRNRLYKRSSIVLWCCRRGREMVAADRQPLYFVVLCWCRSWNGSILLYCVLSLQSTIFISVCATVTKKSTPRPLLVKTVSEYIAAKVWLMKKFLQNY